MYKYILRPLLFRLPGIDAERAHEGTLALLKLFSRTPGLPAWLAYRHRMVQELGGECRVFGLHFASRLGLAAGMDKEAAALAAWAAMGFGFVEVGTVTWHAQAGNPRPRLFRLPDHAALINRMGFNNSGAAAMAERLARQPWIPLPVGISLGKSRITPLEAAIDDYCASLRLLYPYAGYFAVNVSSPNTPGLRALQDRAQLDALLERLQAENAAQAEVRQLRPRPLLIKIAPDLSEPAILDVLQVCADRRVAGIIAINTTLDRAGLAGAPAALIAQAGGLSGRPLRRRARQIVSFISRETGGQLPIIGVGGIGSADDALRMLDAGASLLQLYTGLVYAGPGLVGRINRVTRGACGTREPGKQ